MQEQKDIESDFWKEIFRHLQHRNMSRIDAKRLSVAEAPKEIEEFKKKHKDVFVQSEKACNFVTFETEIAENIKLRLFIQNQIKASLLQNIKGEWIKIADAKFPNNPFSEVELLLENRQKYQNELKKQKHESLKNDIKSRVTIELIKSMLMKKYSVENEFISVFQESEESEKFLVKLSNIKNSEEKQFELSKDNFINEILTKQF